MAGLGAANDSRTPTMFVSGSTPPSAGVDVGYLWYDTAAGSLKVATSVGPVVWAAVGGGSTGGDPVPTGAILLMASGTCPAYRDEIAVDVMAKNAAPLIAERSATRGADGFGVG